MQPADHGRLIHDTNADFCFRQHMRGVVNLSLLDADGTSPLISFLSPSIFSSAPCMSCFVWRACVEKGARQSTAGQFVLLRGLKWCDPGPNNLLTYSVLLLQAAGMATMKHNFSWPNSNFEHFVTYNYWLDFDRDCSQRACGGEGSVPYTQSHKTLEEMLYTSFSTDRNRPYHFTVGQFYSPHFMHCLR